MNLQAISKMEGHCEGAKRPKFRLLNPASSGIQKAGQSPVILKKARLLLPMNRERNDIDFGFLIWFVTIRLLLTFFCCSVSLPGQTSVSVDSTLKEIEELYNSAQYITAELESRRLNEEATVADSIKVQIEKWIAFSLIAQGKTSSARERFVAILSINPDFELDPVLTSPKILSVFYDAKTKFSAQKKNQPGAGGEGLPLSQQVTYRTILFPGWEQLYQGRTTSGGIFLGAGAATLGAGIAFELLRSNARKEYLQAITSSDISTKYNLYNTYRKAEVYSFIAFAVVYLASEIDVISNSYSTTLSIEASQPQMRGPAVVLSMKF